MTSVESVWSLVVAFAIWLAVIGNVSISMTLKISSALSRLLTIGRCDMHSAH